MRGRAEIGNSSVFFFLVPKNQGTLGASGKNDTCVAVRGQLCLPACWELVCQTWDSETEGLLLAFGFPQQSYPPNGVKTRTKKRGSARHLAKESDVQNPPAKSSPMMKVFPLSLPVCEL